MRYSNSYIYERLVKRAPALLSLILLQNYDLLNLGPAALGLNCMGKTAVTTSRELTNISKEKISGSSLAIFGSI